MILLDKCPICNGQKLVKKIDCIDYSTSKEKFTIVSCETCNFTFTNPRPKDESLGEYYKSDMYISHTNNTKGLFNWMYQTVRNYAIGTKVSLLKIVKEKGVHLDIGCGTGEFLNACENEGFSTKGIEPSALARQQAIDNFKLSVSENTDLEQFQNNEFDSISMWHVLEHIPNLNKTIKQFERILNTKGKVIIAVPNHKSWDANYYKEYWAAWDVPIHLWHFSKETIEKLFNKHGFILMKKKPMLFDSFYVSLLSEEFKTGKKKFISGFTIGLISNIIGLFTKRGCSSIIYVFERDNQSI
ncbi:MAG: class I SAM-dependent methyltransferase [Flavobacteriales bacterium]|nr:class I SAM-dependent methyltransferase [Flavobacteriales bacterium]